MFDVLPGRLILRPELCVDDLRYAGIVLRLLGVLSSLLVIELCFGIEVTVIFALTSCLSLRVLF